MSQEFVIPPEVEELRQVVRRWCGDASSQAQVRLLMDSEDGVDLDAWRALAADLGVVGLGVAEEFDGSGSGLVTQAVVLEELGASLFPGPVVGTMLLAVPVLNALGDQESKGRYLPGLVAGESVATVAGPVYDARFGLADLAVTATEASGGWRLAGSVPHVPDLRLADLVLVPARTPAGPAIFAVDATAPGVRRRPESTLDLTRRQGRLDLSSAPGALVAGADEAPAAWSSALRSGATLLAAEQVGGSQRVLDLTVEYVGQRIQFGRIVGSFQAVKHRCADMLIAVEQARSAAYHAAWALDDRTDDPALATALAQATASAAYRRVAADGIQMHGGIGFTWEYPAHLYYKRATADSLLLGSIDEHLDVVAELALDRRDASA